MLVNIGEGYHNRYVNSSKCVVLDLNASYNVNDNLTIYLLGRNITNQNYVYLNKRGYIDEYGGHDITFGKSFQIGATYKF